HGPQGSGGGYEIRTREGLPPTRFPSVRPRPLGESSAGEDTRFRPVVEIGLAARSCRQVGPMIGMGGTQGRWGGRMGLMMAVGVRGRGRWRPAAVGGGWGGWGV